MLFFALTFTRTRLLFASLKTPRPLITTGRSWRRRDTSAFALAPPTATASQLSARYYGSETLYSGITGEPLTADIFIGVVYYQRLRQMVSDKYVSNSASQLLFFFQCYNACLPGIKFGLLDPSTNSPSSRSRAERCFFKFHQA